MPKIELSGNRATINLEIGDLPENAHQALLKARRNVSNKIGNLMQMPGFAYISPEVYGLIHPEKPRAFLDMQNNVVFFSDTLMKASDQLEVKGSTVLTHEIVHASTVRKKGNQIHGIGFVNLPEPMDTTQNLAHRNWKLKSFEENSTIGAINGFRNAPFQPQDLAYTEAITDFASFLMTQDHVLMMLAKNKRLIAAIDNLSLHKILSATSQGNLPKEIIEIMLANDKKAMEDRLKKLARGNDQQSKPILGLLASSLTYEIVNDESYNSVIIPYER